MLPDEIGTVYFADILALEKAQATMNLGDHAGVVVLPVPGGPANTK